MKEDVAKALMEKVKLAEDSLIRLETQNEAIMKNLKEDYNLVSIEEAEKYLDGLDSEITVLEKEEVDLTEKINNILNKDVN